MECSDSMKDKDYNLQGKQSMFTFNKDLFLRIWKKKMKNY